MNKSDLHRIIKEEISKVLNERLSPDRQERLDDLITQVRSSTDPDREYNDYDGPEEEEIINTIRQEFGDTIADQVNNNNFNFPRHGWSPTNDPLEDTENSNNFSKPRITTGGKMHQQDINKRKSYFKRGY